MAKETPSEIKTHLVQKLNILKQMCINLSMDEVLELVRSKSTTEIDNVARYIISTHWAT